MGIGTIPLMVFRLFKKKNVYMFRQQQQIDKIGKNELQNAIVEFPTTNISTHIDLADIIRKLRG